MILIHTIRNDLQQTFICFTRFLLVYISMAFELARDWTRASDTSTESETPTGCFDCNICFDSAHDPVVTLCGHLYCWPCIYKWFHFQSASLASDEHPQCPICKSEISHTTLVPLYGRGQTDTDADQKGKVYNLGRVIPPRPPALGIQHLSNPSNSVQRLPYRNPYQNPYRSNEEDTSSSSPLFNLGGAIHPSYYHPMVGMFSEMIYAGVFGSSENSYAYPNLYSFTGNGNNIRLRRQEMQADKSLSRISFFLFCCFFVCLLLF